MTKLKLYFLSSQDKVGSEQCNECPAGTFSHPGSGYCIKCSKGSFTDKAGQAQCSFCPAGTFADQEGEMSGTDRLRKCWSLIG